jgi:hypothetical protein
MPIQVLRAQSTIEWEREQALRKQEEETRRAIATEKHLAYVEETRRINEQLDAQQARMRAQQEHLAKERAKTEAAVQKLADQLEDEQALRDRAQAILNERAGQLGVDPLQVPPATPADMGAGWVPSIEI